MTIKSFPQEDERDRRTQEISQGGFESDALRINLEETAVEQVAVDPKYEVLQETVEGFRGIQKTIDALLFELNHPFKNWEIILPEMRAFALKHFSAYARHPKGPWAIGVIIDVFFDAVMNSGRDALETKAVDYLLGYAEKIASELNEDNQEKLLTVLRACFQRLSSLPEKQFFFSASSHIPLKRIGQILLRKLPEKSRFDEFNGLLIRSLQAAYRYWLQEEDPCLWFSKDQEIAACPGGKEMDILEKIAHPRLKEFLAALDKFSPEDRLVSGDGSMGTLRSLLNLPGYLEIVRAYKEIPRHFNGSPQ